MSGEKLPGAHRLAIVVGVVVVSWSAIGALVWWLA